MDKFFCPASILAMRLFIPIFGKIVAWLNWREKRTDARKSNSTAWLKVPAAGSASRRTGIRSVFEGIDLATEGISKASIDNLATLLGVSKKKMAEEILLVSVKTIERKKANDKLDKRTSSHAIEIARVMQHAYEVFEDEEKAKAWLNKENRALQSKKPVELLETLSGINLVNDVLGRIEEGVYS